MTALSITGLILGGILLSFGGGIFTGSVISPEPSHKPARVGCGLFILSMIIIYLSVKGLSA